MLVSFSVANFLSIRDRVDLSMIAVDHDKSLPDSIITTHLKREKPRPLRLLKSAVIYGPNASGKTNILKAIRTFSHFVATSIQNAGNPIPVVSFALDPQMQTQPSSFEISLIEDGTLFRYGFAANNFFVHSEYLFATDRAGERKIFERRLKPLFDGKNIAFDEYVYEYGPSGKDLRKVEQFVRTDSLLLSVAASYNYEECKALFTRIGALPLTGLEHASRKTSLAAVIKTEQNAVLLSDIVKYLDFGFPKLTLYYSSPMRTSTARCDEPPEPTVAFVYTDSSGKEVLLDEITQSDGTIIFLNLLADIVTLSRKGGGILYLDEVEASLHPLLCEALFRFVYALPGDALQLICTTHNTQLLNADLFRRDQVWLTEKNKDGATDLYSLADFQGKPRKDARLGKQYLEGRFGGLPLINTARVEEIFSRVTTAPEAVKR